eukprot:3145850-Rhodomonas_salina.1
MVGRGGRGLRMWSFIKLEVTQLCGSWTALLSPCTGCAVSGGDARTLCVTLALRSRAPAAREHVLGRAKQGPRHVMNVHHEA